MIPFVHLHNHSEYSLLDGASRNQDMVRWAKENNMPAIALTDHGVLYGSIEFYKTAQREGVKPILGCEVYVAPKSRFEKNTRDRDEENAYHLVLLAENETGWKNIIKLVSLGHLEGFYYKPRVDKELLSQHKEGIIALSACLAGEISSLFLRGDLDGAKRSAEEYLEIFGNDHFFLEVQDQGLEIQKSLNQFIFELGEELSVRVVATNDAHYIKKADAKSQDVLMCIQMQKNIDDTNRIKFPSDEFYLKNGEEMSSLFPDHPEVISNTVEIAERCNVIIDFGNHLLPQFLAPEGQTDCSFLRKLCEDFFVIKYPEATEVHNKRLEHELKTIEDMGFSSYFLIVWDFVRFAKEHQIPVGPGRGSAAGSMVAYLLGITNLDPIRYQLLFERFLNPERITMPDIDIDFCYERRSEVLEYVVQKYGTDRVAQIITFGTLAARAAVRDVGRVMGIPYSEVDQVAKSIPRELGITLKKALRQSSELKSFYDKGGRIQEMIDIAQSIEGMPRNASTHAAGVVITPDSLTNYVPLQNSSEGWITTQWDKDRVEELGLLKMDLLGLTTLTIIRHTLENIKLSTGNDLDIDMIPTDDKKVAQMLKSGKTAGVFQLESSGMTELVKQITPRNFEEIIPLVALFRPGPLGSGMVEDFIIRKHGRKKIEYLHPDLEGILEETFGVILYQEQVMKIASLMAGFSLGEADLLRRAMSKKKADVIASEKNHFVEGAVERGYTRKLAEETFDLIAHFADYGFNKSHSAPYAWIAYQTAWLKAHYPAEFMAALITNSMRSSDKVAYYMDVTRQMGIRILPPDIHQSGVAFQVDKDGKIRFGLTAIKNIGESAVQNILEERKKGEFFSFHDFCNRVDTKIVNKRVIENLIKSGAFDSFGFHRSQLLAILDSAVDQSLSKQKNQEAGFMDLFDLSAEGAQYEETLVPELAEVSPEEIQIWEKELIGFYVSSHPLDQYEDELKAQSLILSLSEIEKDKKWVGVGGIFIESKRITTQKGELMSFSSLEDYTSGIEVIMFPKIFERYGKYILPGSKVLVFGRLQVEEEKASKVLAQHIIPLGNDSIRLCIEINKKFETDENLQRIQNTLKNFHGQIPVLLRFIDQKKMIRTFEEFWVTPSAELLESLNVILPESMVYFMEEK